MLCDAAGAKKKVLTSHKTCEMKQMLIRSPLSILSGIIDVEAVSGSFASAPEQLTRRVADIENAQDVQHLGILVSLNRPAGKMLASYAQLGNWQGTYHTKIRDEQGRTSEMFSA